MKARPLSWKLGSIASRYANQADLVRRAGEAGELPLQVALEISALLDKVSMIAGRAQKRR